jgi:hypothetical protein
LPCLLKFDLSAILLIPRQFGTTGQIHFKKDRTGSFLVMERLNRMREELRLLAREPPIVSRLEWQKGNFEKHSWDFTKLLWKYNVDGILTPCERDRSFWNPSAMEPRSVLTARSKPEQQVRLIGVGSILFGRNACPQKVPSGSAVHANRHLHSFLNRNAKVFSFILCFIDVFHAVFMPF